MPRDSHDTAFVFRPFGAIPALLFGRCISKVLYSVVIRPTINMVDFSLRPRSVMHRPGNTMREIPLIVYRYLTITFIQSPRDLAGKPCIPRFAWIRTRNLREVTLRTMLPQKFTRQRVVSQALMQVIYL